DGPDEWKKFFTDEGSLEEMQDQMKRQSEAAGMRLVKWHFADAQVADYFRKWAQDSKLHNVVVIHTPASE
ncbi:MAG: hypothetical protein ACRD3W_24675, partial [Terriglobales bacterium]